MPHPFQFPPRKGRDATKAGVAPRGCPCEFIEGHRHRLAEIHRRLARVGRDFDEHMAEGQIVAREAMLLGAEDQRYSAPAIKLGHEYRGHVWQGENWLLGLAVGERAGAGDECSFGYRFGEGFRALRILKQFRSAHGRACLAPVRVVGSNHGETGKTEVGHGARDRTDVERIARRHEDNLDAVALGLGEQGMIVERLPITVLAKLLHSEHVWSPIRLPCMLRPRRCARLRSGAMREGGSRRRAGISA